MEDVFNKIRRIQIKTLREVQDLFAGAYHSVFKGQGLTFEEVREYQEGDEVRYIDWNVTARMQHPYVKQFREERELTVMLVVDISASAHFSSTGRLKSELIAEIGALLAFSAIKNHDKVGLLLFSSEIELYLAPKKTLRHVLRVIRELLSFKPNEKGTDINKALSFLGKMQHKPCICFLISDFLVPSFGTQLSLAAKKYDLIAIKVSDPSEESFPDCGLIELEDLETGHTGLIDSSNPELRDAFKKKAQERNRAFRSTMGRLGIDQISINTLQSYIGPLQQFFKMRRARR